MNAINVKKHPNRRHLNSGVVMKRLDRSEGVYKHNERFVFFTDEIDFIKPERFYTPEYLYQKSRECCYGYLKEHNRDTDA